MRIQACGTPSIVRVSVAPFRARTKNGRLWARQAAMMRRGSSPPPATMPSLAPAIELGLAQAADRFRAREIKHVPHRLHGRELLVDLGEALGEGTRLVAEQHLEGGAQRLDVLARIAAALHAHDVQPRQPGAVANHRAERNDVALDAGDAADHGIASDAHELMHRRKAAEDGVILDADVTGQRRVIGHDDMIADDAVMRDVRSHHEQAIIADPRDHAAARGAGVHGDVLADDVAAADLEARFLALVFQILRRVTDRSEGKDPRAVAHRGTAADGDMRHELDILAELDPWPHHAERADFDRGRNFGARLDHGRRMNLGHRRPLNYCLLYTSDAADDLLCVDL